MNIKRKAPVSVIAFSLLLVVGYDEGGFECVDANQDAIASTARITFSPAFSEANAATAR